MYNSDKSNFNEKVIQFRIMVIGVMVAFILVILIARISYIQLFKNSNYSEKSQKTREYFVRIPRIRGRIISDDGKILANNKKTYNISIDPKSLSKDYQLRQNALIYIGNIVGIDYADLENMLSKALIKNEKLTLSENISFLDFIKISENVDKMEGINAEENLIRDYPNKDVLSHVIGYIGPIDYNEFSKLKNEGYKQQDWIGKIGIENSYEKYLKGSEGFISYETDAKMNVNKKNIIRKKNAMPGDDLVLSINMDFQKSVEGILSDRMGGIVVLKPSSGEILALASYPDFDPNIYIIQNDENYSKRKEISLDAKGTPLINRCMQSEYPPGSTFKMVSGFIIVEEDVVPLTKTYVCTGQFRLNSQTFGCWAVHGAENLFGAISDSCDVYFYNTSLIFGIEKITQYAKYFGFGKTTGIDIPYERKGFVPSVDSVKEKGSVWYLGNTLNTVIGQGDVTATVLQLANYTAAIANKGVSYKPHLVKKIIDPDTGVVKKDVKPEVLTTVNLSEKSFDFIMSAMRNVVVDGTATGAFIRVPFAIAGKTGTAEVGLGAKKQTNSLFVGYGPVDYPIEDQIVVAVLIEQYNGHNLKYAGNVAAMVFNSWLSKEDFPTSAKRLWYPVKESYN